MRIEANTELYRLSFGHTMMSLGMIRDAKRFWRQAIQHPTRRAT